MDILILSPYDALSHQYWRRGLVDLLSEHRFTVADLPARHFSWRFRGNSLTLAHSIPLQKRYDLVIATSMTDLSALKGMNKYAANTPSILYFHENQFAYPDDSSHVVERQMTSIYSAVAADRLVFNSFFNQTSFLDGAKSLLKRMPDGVPEGIVSSLSAKSEVISVAIQPDSLVSGTSGAQMEKKKEGQIDIVWNHRWEYDKGTLELQRLLEALPQTLNYQFHLIGQSFRTIPPEIDRIREFLTHKGRLGQFGFIKDKEQYFSLLQHCDLVLSTARHEFQGIAVLEAVQAGCLPVVPDDLAYKEFIPAEFRYKNHEQAISLILKFASNALPQSIRLPPEVGVEAVQKAWRDSISKLIT